MEWLVVGVVLLVGLFTWLLFGKARVKDKVPLPARAPSKAVPEWKRRQQRSRARRVLTPRYMTFEKANLRVAVVPDGTYYAVKHGTWYRLGRTGVDKARQAKQVRAAVEALEDDTVATPA